MLNSAAINQIIGALTAGLIGVFAALLLKWIDESRRQKSVARAILQEMLQTVNALIVALLIIERGAVVADTGFSRNMVRDTQLKKMRPFERKVFSALGEHLGALSDKALSNTVAFDGTIQALDRLFDNYEVIEDHGMVTHDACAHIAQQISHALRLSEANILAVIWDAHGPLWKTPGPTLHVLEQIRAMPKDES